tara:strand:+ start:432 stop:812 length:381 start_codon:yes stop_codon:yes gene_type:complete
MRINYEEMPDMGCINVKVTIPTHQAELFEGISSEFIDADKDSDEISYGVIVAKNSATLHIYHLLKSLGDRASQWREPSPAYKEYSRLDVYLRHASPRELPISDVIGNRSPDDYINKLLKALDTLWN